MYDGISSEEVRLSSVWMFWLTFGWGHFIAKGDALSPFTIIMHETFYGLYNRTSSVADLILYSASAANRRLAWKLGSFLQHWHKKRNALRLSGFVTSIWSSLSFQPSLEDIDKSRYGNSFILHQSCWFSKISGFKQKLSNTSITASKISDSSLLTEMKLSQNWKP